MFASMSNRQATAVRSASVETKGESDHHFNDTVLLGVVSETRLHATHLAA